MNKEEMEKKDELTNELIKNLEELKKNVKTYQENGENLKNVSTSLEKIEELIQALFHTNKSLQFLSSKVSENSEKTTKYINESLPKIKEELFQGQKKYFMYLMVIILIILGVNIYNMML